jgi:rhamnosyltransferase
MKRVLVFALSHPGSELPALLQYTLDTLKSVYSRVVIVAAGHPNADLIEHCKHIGEVMFTKLDAPASWTLWREGLYTLGLARLNELEEIHLLHDRSVGPLTDPLQWSLPNEPDVFIRSNEYYGLHAPCSFVAFGRDVINSEQFSRFWNHAVPTDMSAEESGQMVLELRRMLSGAGFVDGFRLVMDTNDGFGLKDEDREHLMPDMLILNRFAFIDLDAVLSFPHPDYLFDLLVHQTHFDSSKLVGHISRELTPNQQINILNKNVLVTSRVNNKPDTGRKSLRVGVHLHVFYPDVGQELLGRLAESGVRADLVLTSDAQSKIDRVMEYIAKLGTRLRVRHTEVLVNRGRDMLPWLTVGKVLSEYDLAGHFHTKKTAWSESWFGASWMSELMDTLVDPAGQIVSMFEDRPELGIVIPDIPYVYKMKPRGDAWGKNRETCTKLWRRLNRVQKIDFEMLDVPIMPFGNMYWYRPAALQPLVGLGFSVQEFDSEPLPVDGTLAHSLERMHVYVAWSQGYDFRVLISDRHVRSTMDLYSRASIPKTILELKKKLKAL